MFGAAGPLGAHWAIWPLARAPTWQASQQTKPTRQANKTDKLRGPPRPYYEYEIWWPGSESESSEVFPFLMILEWLFGEVPEAAVDGTDGDADSDLNALRRERAIKLFTFPCTGPAGPAEGLKLGQGVVAGDRTWPNHPLWPGRGPAPPPHPASCPGPGPA